MVCDSDTLFLMALAAVLVAIVGLAVYDKEQETLLRNASYVNSTIGQVDDDFAAHADPNLQRRRLDIYDP